MGMCMVEIVGPPLTSNRSNRYLVATRSRRMNFYVTYVAAVYACRRKCPIIANCREHDEECMTDRVAMVGEPAMAVRQKQQKIECAAGLVRPMSPERRMNASVVRYYQRTKQR